MSTLPLRVPTLADGQLSLEEVRDRAGRYTPEIRDQAFRLGELMLAEIVERTAQIESKASIAFGFATTALAFLVGGSTIGPDAKSAWHTVAVGVEGAAAILLTTAAIFCFRALRPRTYRWFSDRTWFPDWPKNPSTPATVETEALPPSIEQVKLGQLLDLFGHHRLMHDANESKGHDVIKGQWFLLAAVGCLLFTWLLKLLS